jgi:hypothetical protein
MTTKDKEVSFMDCPYYKGIRDSVGYCTLNESCCEVDTYGDTCEELEELKYAEENVGG